MLGLIPTYQEHCYSDLRYYIRSLLLLTSSVSLTFDLSVKRQVFSALSQIAKHSVDLAEMVVEAEIFPAVLTALKDRDDFVKKNVATLIREIAKHTPEVSLNHASRTSEVFINPIRIIFLNYNPNENITCERLQIM